MAFAVDGGIEWEKDETNKKLTIRPASTPEEGYTSGQMKDYETYPTDTRPWGVITETGWTLTLEDGITNIGNNAFGGCTGFNGSLTIPNSVQTIGAQAFGGCTGFNGSLILPSGLTSFSEFAFYNCSGFTGSLIIPNSVQTIGAQAFGVCTGFNSTLTIGDNVTLIDEYAFSGCSGFTGTLTIPNNVTNIGDYAFYKCSNFSDVKFLSNQPTLGESAFELFTGPFAYVRDVYSNGWANKDTFPSYTYIEWNYIDTTPKYITKNGLKYYTTKVKTAMTNGTVTKIGTVDVGSATQPIYLNAGTPTAGITITSGPTDPSGEPAGGIGSIYIKYSS